MTDTLIVALIGFGGGLLLGLAARLGRFCTLGAIEDYLYQGSSVRLRMWGVAIGLSTVAVFVLTALRLFDPGQSIYYLAAWSPLASILGGLLFGYGMSMSGTCGFGALARLGGGDLRSFVVVLVMGIAAYVMLSGPLAGIRVALIGASALDTPVASYPALLSAVTGLSVPLIGGALGLAILAVSLSEVPRRGGPARLPGGRSWRWPSLAAGPAPTGSPITALPSRRYSHTLSPRRWARHCSIS